MAQLSDPRYFPYRLLVFGLDGTLRLKAYPDKVTRDREAREMDNETLALAVTVDFLINGGDEPKRPLSEPKKKVSGSRRRNVVRSR